jgi:murein DD-endopeptidase MepM/ murein hydrolase activator NlpD
VRQTNEMFIHGRKSLLAETKLARLFERYLTLISIGVTLVGIVLLVVGPVRAILGKSPAPATGGGTEQAGQQVGLASLSGVGILDPVDLSRQLVAYTIIPDRPRKAVSTYVVQAGDTLYGIAAKFNIDPKTIFWSNAVLEDDVHMLRPGVELSIPPVDGVYFASNGTNTLEQDAKNYQADVSAILDSPYNELAGYAAADVPPWGMKILVPGGKRDLAWKNPIVAVTDTHTGKTVYGFMPGMGGSCSNISGGGGTGSWVRPVNDYMITQGFHDGHTGVDLGAPVGTPVYAADSGVVIFSGWNTWGYGNLIVIDHSGPGGWTTYYGHLNSIAVGCGAVVGRGQYIGQVGSTGNSSGAHLHFEMRWNNVPSNPAGLIGF